MAKYSIAPADIQKIVTDVANENGLAQIGIDFQALVTVKGKDVIKVVKANEFTEIVSERSDLVFVLIRQDVFDAVDEQTQYMWVRAEMEKITYDSEKDKIIIGVPSITVPATFYEKYKEKAIESALLQIYTLAQIMDKEKAEKESKKKGKKNN